MKRDYTGHFCVLTSLLIICAAGLALAAVSGTMNYQGRLTNASGQNVPDGTYSLKFKIYDASLVGTTLWAETLNVSVASGLFSVQLGAVHSLSSSIFSGPDRWLGIAIGTDPESAPRSKFTTVAYAFSVDGGGGAFLPLSGGVMTGPVTNAGNPSITMGKGNFGTNSSNPGAWAFVAGSNNAASADYSAVGSGYGDTASGRWSVVSGGLANGASDDYAFVGGGRQNFSTHLSAIVGGSFNTAVDSNAFVGGGSYNSAGFHFATVGGGFSNTAFGTASVVAGGDHCTANGDFAGVLSGKNNTTGQVDPDSAAVVAGGYRNHAKAKFSFVGSGTLDTASGSYSVVAGGYDNLASGERSFVGGGETNIASGYASMVPGGSANVAAGYRCFAAGLGAHANHDNTFIWGDGTPADYNSDRSNQTKFRVGGGMKVDVNNSRWIELYDTGTRLINTSTTAYLSTSGNWVNASDGHLKENFRDVDGRQILLKLDELPITEWNYTIDNEQIKHIGPTAQDFYSAFGLGVDTVSISTIDPSGVALAAIKELSKQNQALSAQNDSLKKQLDELSKKVEMLVFGK